MEVKCDRVFPDKPISAKPAETRMGSGKGAVDHWVAVVKPGAYYLRDWRRPREVARSCTPGKPQTARRVSLYYTRRRKASKLTERRKQVVEYTAGEATRELKNCA